MEEERTYAETYTVDYVGLDNKQYAVLHKDSTLTLSISSNGFSALRMSMKRKPIIKVRAQIPSSAVDTNTTTLSIDLHKQEKEIIGQVSSDTKYSIELNTPQLHIQLAKRNSKTYTPNIDNITFSFSGLYGTYGDISIIPPTVTVYGSSESLDKIDKVEATTTRISNI